MNKLNWIVSLIAVGVLAFLVGYIVGGSGTDPEKEVSVEQTAKLPTVAKGLEGCLTKGPDHAKVTIVEFTDFQ